MTDEPRDHNVGEGGDGTDLTLPEQVEPPPDPGPDESEPGLPTPEEIERNAERLAGLKGEGDEE